VVKLQYNLLREPKRTEAPDVPDGVREYYVAVWIECSLYPSNSDTMVTRTVGHEILLCKDLKIIILLQSRVSQYLKAPAAELRGQAARTPVIRALNVGVRPSSTLKSPIFPLFSFSLLHVLILCHFVLSMLLCSSLFTVNGLQNTKAKQNNLNSTTK